MLLGSGISRAAKILTGHEITGELIKRIALAQKADVGDDPHSWYFKTFDTQPKYDDLLAKLAPSADDRHMLLRPYFEPNDADRSSGDKRPTVAHKAIVRLVKKGFIRVIITTNFDHLIEQALESEGVAFTVVYTDNMVSGMLPLVHGGVIIIKVNGDYTNPRLRNTEDELTSYGNEMRNLLSRVFDEYGLIVCGWSAKWDKGLCELIEKSPNRRFSSFWTTVNTPDPELEQLIRNRQGNLISIDNADSFFSSLERRSWLLNHFRTVRLSHRS